MRNPHGSLARLQRNTGTPATTHHEMKASLASDPTKPRQGSMLKLTKRTGSDWYSEVDGNGTSVSEENNPPNLSIEHRFKSSGIATQNKKSRRSEPSPTSTEPLEGLLKCWEDPELIESLDEEQRVAAYAERARRIDEQNRMLNSRKLCLVLDLDHTLLHSIMFTQVNEKQESILLMKEEAALHRDNMDGISRRDLYRVPHLGVWTKLRPGVRNFLARASQLYELHVSTMGMKTYAGGMTKILDPTGDLFAGRVISRCNDDTADHDKKLQKTKDLDGVLGLESAVVIVDDTLHIWPHHKDNVIVVQRYLFFPISTQPHGSPGPSLFETGYDEQEATGMLASVLQVLEKIHWEFFSNKWLHEGDVRSILAALKHTVLAGCKILFSKVFPKRKSQHYLHPLWQTAEAFGAVCTSTIDDKVTHVVASCDGTEKVMWAKSTGRFYVGPAWLEASAALYQRVNELDYPVPL